jgi:2-polyprenyl-3-methyl-5-hydroxy-6-metoxy-1,4-benzoquinol methylase
MRTRLAEELRCPADGAPLTLESYQAANSLITKGLFHCASCKRSFPIVDGIADLRVLAGNDEAVAAKRREIAVRDAEAHEVYDRIVGEYRTCLEIQYTLKYLGTITGRRLLDFGCGTGRVTKALVQGGAEVSGVDYSMLSLREAMSRVGGDGHGLDLIAADVAALPFSAGSFDIVVSNQVLEHLVNAEHRNLMFESIAKMLGPGGLALITTYNYVGSGVRQGCSSAGVPFFCYDRDMLKNDLTHFMDVKQITCVDHQLPCRLPRRLGMSLGLWLDNLIACTKVAWRTGHLLLAVCAKR